MNSEDKLKILKELLLTEEREFDKDLLLKIEKLSREQNELSENISPLMEKRLQEFIEEMPKTLGPTITETLKTEIKKSQDCLLYTSPSPRDATLSRMPSSA